MQFERVTNCGPRSGLFKTLFLCVFLTCPSIVALCADPAGRTGVRIAVFTPTTANNTCWPEVYSILRATVSDLDITLEIHEFDLSDRLKKVSAGVRRLTTEPRPDAAVFSVAVGDMNKAGIH